MVKSKTKPFIITYAFKGLRKTPKGHEIIGKPMRHYLDKEGPKRHLTVAILLKDRQGKYLLQKRSKRVMDPGKLDFSVGGHIDYGLTVEEAARKEAREELGIGLRGLRWLHGPISLTNPKHLTVIFHARAVGKIRPDNDEVDPRGTRYYSTREIWKLAATGKLTRSLNAYFKRANVL